MRRALVTGATGFIGSHLVEHLRREGVAVVAGVRALPASPLAGVQYATFDMETPGAWALDALHGVDCLLHLAAHVHVMKQSVGDKQRFHAVNVAATQALAERAADAGVQRFVFLSSIKVNGERTESRPFTSDDTPAPEDDYGLSKWNAEQALHEVGAKRDLSIAVVRPPLVYGPGVGANFRRLLSWVHAGVPLPLGSIDNRRSLVNVWNLLDCLLTVATDERASGRTWLVSDDEDVSTRQLVEMMGEAWGREARLWNVPVPLLRSMGRLARRGAEVARLVDSLQVDIGQTRERLQWHPRVSLEEGLARTAAWFEEYRS
jgi:nucleoside-diphosphate-sugar epimerase